MKQVKKRRRFLRLNNPIGFSLLCIVCLALVAGIYLLVAFLVRKAPSWIAGASQAIIDSEATASPTENPSPTPFMGVEDTVPPNTPIVGSAAPEDGTSQPDPATEGEETEDTEGTVPAADPSAPLYGVTVGIDPYRDAKSKYDKEREYNLAFAQKLASYLESQGATVVLTRTTNEQVLTDADRVKTLNDAGCTVAIRLLCNHIDSSKTRGTYIQTTKSSTDFAVKMIASYTASTELPTRKDDGYEIKPNDFLVDVKCSAINLIMAHWSNGTDLELLENEEFQRKMMEGICNGILAYVKGA